MNRFDVKVFKGDEVWLPIALEGYGPDRRETNSLDYRRGFWHRT